MWQSLKPTKFPVSVSRLLNAPDVSRSLGHSHVLPPDLRKQNVYATRMSVHVGETHGKNTVYFASAQAGLDHAPMRIAFNRIPDLESER